MSVDKHLASARKYYSQSRLADAIYEYRRVLDLDPNNQEALDVLQSLTDDPAEELAGQSGKIKTNFLAHQAQEHSGSIWKKPPLMVLLSVLVAGAIYGIYQLVVSIMNHDKEVAMRYVEVHLQRPVQKDGQAYLSVEIVNLNPQAIKDTKFKYQISGMDGSTLASDTVTISTAIPAGDTRTFAEVKLAKVAGQASRMHADLVDLQLGPKPAILPENANKFIEAAAMKPVDAINEFTQIVKAQPDFVPAYVRLGQSLLSNNDLDLSIKAFEKAVKLDPEDANAHYHLGVAYFYKADFAAAKKALEEASRLASDDPVISAALKQASVKAGGKDKIKAGDLDQTTTGATEAAPESEPAGDSQPVEK
jgi:tetratricopeptide (TPR) repeat protein